MHLLHCCGLLREGARHGICLLLCFGSHGCPAPAGTLDFLHALGVQTYRHDGAVAHVVLDGDGAAGVFQVLLHHGKPGAGAADIPFHLAVSAGYAKVEGTLFVVDARTLIGKADGIATVEN